MALWTIIRVYEVPAENRFEATDRMMEALAFHAEGQFPRQGRDPGTRCQARARQGGCSQAARWLVGAAPPAARREVACLPTVHHPRDGGRKQGRYP